MYKLFIPLSIDVFPVTEAHNLKCHLEFPFESFKYCLPISDIKNSG